MTLQAQVGVRQFPVVRQYMTPTPLTVGPAQSLAAARRLMRDHKIRHLPVLDGGQLVGLVSERDLILVESLPGVNPTEVRVEEAMSQNVFTIVPDAPIGEVVETLIKGKLGSAVVSEASRIVGVFTTIDALRALHDLLEQR